MITKKTYTETYIVLETLDLLKELPENVVQGIKNNVISDYRFYIDKDVPIKFQVNDKDTLSFLSYIYIKYFCKDEKEKMTLKENVNENEELNKKKRNEEYELVFLRNRSNFDADTQEKRQEEKQIVEVKKENLFQKIINKLRNLFKR